MNGIRIKVTAVRVFDVKMWHVQCPECLHDDFHTPDGSLRDGLVGAVERAESMWFDHLTGVGHGRAAVCPIREYAWELERLREQHGASPVRPRQPT